MSNATPTEPPAEDVPITKEALQIDLADMTAQLAQLLTDANKVQGAIIFCTRLIAVMEGRSPMTLPAPTMPTQQEVDRMAAEAKAADTAARAAQAKKPPAKPKPKPK